MLAVAFILIAFHPISMTAHYRLLSAKGRYIYKERGHDYPYCTGPEIVMVLMAILFATVGGWFVANYSCR